MNEGSFPNGNGNTTPFSLAEIWQFPVAINGGGGGLGLRRPQFGNGLGQFGEFGPGLNRDGNGPESRVVLNHVGGGKKRRDSEDGSAKCVSTSNGGANAVVFFFFSFVSFFWKKFIAVTV